MSTTPSDLKRPTNPTRIWYVKRDLEMMLKVVEQEIMATPTSEWRNRLTELNIHLMLAYDQVKYLEV